MTAQGSAVSAVRWSALSRYGAQLMQFAVSLAMARILAPELFGLFGMATVITGFVKTCSNLGFRAAIVQRKETSPTLISTLFWANLCVCCVVAVLTVAAAPIAARFYNEPRVTAVIAVLSLNFIGTGLVMVPNAMLQRRLDFKKLAFRELASAFVGGATALGFALAGFGVWAFVISTLVNSVTQVILLNLLNPVRILFCFDRESLRESLSFGINITGNSIFNYFARNADNLIIGATLGPVALGYYSFAYRLMLVPRDALTQVVNRVLFPKLSKLQDNDSQIASISIRSCEFIAFFSLPMMIGLAVLARPFVLVAVGEKWLPAVPVIWLLAPLGVLYSLAPIATNIMLSKGRSDVFFRWGVFNGVILIISFLLGQPWGIVGVATAYSIASTILILMSFRIAFRYVETASTADLIKAITPYVVMTAIMAIIVHLTFTATSIWLPLTAGLLSSIIAGAASYLAMALILKPSAMETFHQLVPMRSFKFSTSLD